MGWTIGIDSYVNEYSNLFIGYVVVWSNFIFKTVYWLYTGRTSNQLFPYSLYWNYKSYILNICCNVFYEFEDPNNIFKPIPRLILVKSLNDKKQPKQNYFHGLCRSTSRRRGRYMLARSCSCRPGSRCNWTTCCPAISLTTAATENPVSPTQIIQVHYW